MPPSMPCPKCWRCCWKRAGTPTNLIKEVAVHADSVLKILSAEDLFLNSTAQNYQLSAASPPFTSISEFIAYGKCCVCGGGDSPYNSPSSTTTCAAGKYMDYTTNTCTACPAGQYQAEDGFSGGQCWTFNQGEESAIGATECHQTTHTPAVPVCNPCTSYAQFQDEHQLQYRQDSAGKCWSTK